MNRVANLQHIAQLLKSHPGLRFEFVGGKEPEALTLIFDYENKNEAVSIPIDCSPVGFSRIAHRMAKIVMDQAHAAGYEFEADESSASPPMAEDVQGSAGAPRSTPFLCVFESSFDGEGETETIKTPMMVYADIADAAIELCEIVSNEIHFNGRISVIELKPTGKSAYAEEDSPEDQA